MNFPINALFSHTLVTIHTIAASKAIQIQNLLLPTKSLFFEIIFTFTMKENLIDIVSLSVNLVLSLTWEFMYIPSKYCATTNIFMFQTWSVTWVPCDCARVQLRLYLCAVLLSLQAVVRMCVKGRVLYGTHLYYYPPRRRLERNAAQG